MKRLCAVLGMVPLLLAVGASGDALAQGGWLQKGKDFFGGVETAPSGQDRLPTAESARD